MKNFLTKTNDLLNIASFRIGVPSILFFIETWISFNTDESAGKWLQVWLKSCLIYEKCDTKDLKCYEKNLYIENIKLTFDNNTANASS